MAGVFFTSSSGSSPVKGQFRIDRDRIVRWAVEWASEGLAGVGTFASEEEILSAVQTLPRR